MNITFKIIGMITLLLILSYFELDAKESKKQIKKEVVKGNIYDTKLNNLQNALENWINYAKKNRNGDNVYQELDNATRSYMQKYEELSEASSEGKISKTQYKRLVQIYEKYNSYLEQGY